MKKERECECKASRGGAAKQKKDGTLIKGQDHIILSTLATNAQRVISVDVGNAPLALCVRGVSFLGLHIFLR